VERCIVYKIREVDGSDEVIADALKDLHEQTFLESAKVPDFSHGHWWLAHLDEEPVAFAGVIPSTRAVNAGYFLRVGVLLKHCGNRLQLRFMRAIERKSKYNGWCQIVSDTTDNLSSANNFIRAGYQLYTPEYPWAFPSTLYWRKAL
jgi:hypothetical protein